MSGVSDDLDAVKPTIGLWAVMASNLYRVVAPAAPHRNMPSGICPPFPYAIVCETNPESVGGEEAARNASAISKLPEMNQMLLEMRGEIVRLEKQLRELREQCAVIAEAGDPDCSNCRVDFQCCSCPDTSKLIARRIREGAAKL